MSKKHAGVDTIVVSDIHLGSSVSRVKELTNLIEKKYCRDDRCLFDRLVLLGDIFDDYGLTDLREEDWKFLSLIRELASPQNGVEVVWLRGNHDAALEEAAQGIFGAPVRNDYEWRYGGKRFVAVHGHLFDTFLLRRPKISHFFSKVYLVIQRVDSEKQHVSRFFKRLSKRVYLSKRIYQDMIGYARTRSADVIFGGHTHHACTIRAKDGIEYYNPGCWTDIPSSYITIDKEGIKLHEVW